ncbi:hypothetical protein AMECASPLE_035057 [Ameca splendens]|uniref:Uncharacterized protein n=1 Tax=Ameca splendens TaxID=208324 RepID=A0ABV0ZUB3_9TELE
MWLELYHKGQHSGSELLAASSLNTPQQIIKEIENTCHLSSGSKRHLEAKNRNRPKTDRHGTDPDTTSKSGSRSDCLVRTRVRLSVFTPVQKVRTKGGNELWSV